jgi:ribosomal protein S18 acetylase RimI-like enzyme
LPTEKFFRHCVKHGEVFVSNSVCYPLPSPSFVVAYALVTGVDTMLRLDRPFLRSIATIPTEQGKGRGGQLLREVAVYCREAGNDAITLHVKQDNIKAQILYLKNGYTIQRVIPQLYEAEGAGIEMEKIL